MSVAPSAIFEIEDAIRGSSTEKRVEMLRRVSDLFLSDPGRYREEQVSLFDDVLDRLIGQIEDKVLVEFGQRFAPIGNAPIKLVRRLAHHHDIDVAGPVLSLSPRLAASDLAGAASTLSHAHLMSISKRQELVESVTDILIERGSNLVANSVAANPGARISDAGFRTLVAKSETDDSLAVTIGLRSDIPEGHFRQLLNQATNTVRSHLMSQASPEIASKIESALRTIASELGVGTVVSLDYAAAEKLTKMMHQENRLGEAELLEFATSLRVAETVAALSILSAAPIKLIDRVIHGLRVDAVLIPCKAAKLSWATVQAIIGLMPVGRMTSEETARRDFLALSQSTAQRIVRFWQVRSTVRLDMN
jgi:uncharacterized protein (DUF2336 family)